MGKSRKRQDGDSSLQESNSATATATAVNPERISIRAYELYLARGGADGQAWDDWLAAERELAENGSAGSRDDDAE
jgi:hypothetical protein